MSQARFRPRRDLLDRHLVSEVLGYFAFGVAMFTTILVAMIELQPLTSMVVEHGVPLVTAIEIFALALPHFMALAFPMAMLLSTLLAFGKLSSESEIIALQAAGVSLYRMAIPVALIGLVVSGAAIAFNEYVAPVATYEKDRLYETAVRAGVPSNRPLLYTYTQAGRRVFTLIADNYDAETHKLLNPTLIAFDQTGKPTGVEFAHTGTWNGGADWTFDKGFIQPISDNPIADTRLITFQGQPTRIGVSLQQLLAASQDPDEMTYRQLRARIAAKVKEGRKPTEIDPDLVKLYSKISIPFASLVFALIGFPLGIQRQRSGHAIGFAISIAIIFVYYLIYQYATILGNNGAIAPVPAVWIPNLLGLAAAGVLLKRASG